MTTPLHTRFPHRDHGWWWATVAAVGCIGVTALTVPVLTVTQLLFQVPAEGQWLWPWSLVGCAAWSFCALVAIGLRIRAAYGGVDLAIDPTLRRISVDGIWTDLADGSSVAVVPHRLTLRARVVVRDETGHELWRLSDLHPTHARCLAIDLSSLLGLFAPADLCRVPTAPDPTGAPTVITPDVDQVAVQVWSIPARFKSLSLLSAALVPMIATVMNPACGPHVAGVLLLATVVLVGALIQVLPRKIHLAIRADRLIVRRETGAEHVPIADLHPTRLVSDGPDGASLLLRSNTGFLCEIRGRPREELETIAWWVDHARTRAVPALPEPVPEVPPELVKLRERRGD